MPAISQPPPPAPGGVAAGRDRARAAAGLAALALPLVALAAAVAAGDRTVAVAPHVGVLVGATGVAAAALMLGGRRPRHWLDLAVAALLGLAAAHVYARPGLPFGHDTLTHLWGSWATASEVFGGDLHPRWLHQLGLGTPLLQFYGPLGYYALLPFAALGVGWPGVVAAGFALFSAGAAMAMYAATLSWVRDRRAALVAAAAYAFAPYRLLDSNYRMALGETAGLVLLPLVLLVTARRARQAHGSMVAPALAIAALLLTHPLTAALAALGHGVWLAADAVALRSLQELGRRAGRLAAAWLLGACLAGFFVVPVAAELKLTSLATFEPATPLAQQALSVEQLLRRRQWDALRLSVGRGAAPVDEMPFYFGCVLLASLPLAAGVGALPGARRRTRRRPGRSLPAGVTALTLAGLAASLHPLAGIAEQLVPPLSVLQFPWRFLTLASCGAALAAGFAAARLLAAGRTGVWAPVASAGLLALLVADAAPYTGAADWLPPNATLVTLRRDPACATPPCWRQAPVDPPVPSRVAGFLLPPPAVGADVGLLCCAFPEYTTVTARQAFFSIAQPERLALAGGGLLALPDGPPLPLPARPYATWQRSGEPPRPRRAVRGGGAVRVEHDGQAGTVVVLEQYFAGWQVNVGDRWREVVPTPQGLLQARVPAGWREVRFRFAESRPDRSAGWALSGATLLAAVVMAVRTTRRRKWERSSRRRR